MTDQSQKTPTDERGVTAADHMRIAAQLDACANRTTDRSALDRAVHASLRAARMLRRAAIAALVTAMVACVGEAATGSATQAEGGPLFAVFARSELETIEAAASCPDPQKVEECLPYTSGHFAFDYAEEEVCSEWTEGRCTEVPGYPEITEEAPLEIVCEESVIDGWDFCCLMRDASTWIAGVCCRVDAEGDVMCVETFARI